MAIIIHHNEIAVFLNSNALFEFAAKDFSQRAMVAVNEKGIFSVVLSGGSTPKTLFEFLTQDANYKKNIPWECIQFFFSDERYVAADDPQSNYHMAHEYLFSKVPIKPENIYRIPTEFANPSDAAQAYEKTLRSVFNLKNKTFPLFDLVYLGLGGNAHTASLMPFTEEVKNCLVANSEQPLVLSTFVADLNMFRLTLTPTAINHGLEIIFLVTGENKAPAVWEVLEGPVDPLHYPAQLIQNMHKKTLWYLDQAAASQLTVKE